MNWNDLSDFEINKAVAECLGLKITEHQYEGDGVRYDAGSAQYPTVDYCNSWSDMDLLLLRTNSH